jgi:hypothetical protein
VIVVALTAIAACVASLGDSTTQQPAIVVNPTVVDLGSAVPIGTTSKTVTLRVSPARGGASDDVIDSITTPGCSGFVVMTPGVPGARVTRTCGPETVPLPADELAGTSHATCFGAVDTPYEFTATFTPVIEGTVICHGEIGFGASAQTFTLRGTGVLPAKAIAVRPADRTIDFVRVRRNESSDPRTVTITNAGATALRVSSVRPADQTLGFAVTGATSNVTIPKGGSETYLVTCTPTDLVQRTTTLDIVSEAPGELEQVTLICEGIDSELAVEPDSLELAALVNASQTRSVTLINQGTLPGTINAIELAPGSDPSLTLVPPDLTGTVLGANTGAATVLVRYDPTTPTSGGIGALVVTFENLTRTIPISGDARVAQVAAIPNRVVFDETASRVCPGQVTTDTFEVLSEQDGSFDVLGASTGPPFAVTPPVLPPPGTVMLPFGAQRQAFTVSIAPTIEAGLIEGKVTVATNAPQQPAFEVAVSAFVLPAGITALPQRIDLGTARIGTITNARSVTFTNCGDAAIEIMNARTTGANAGELRLTRDFVGPVRVEPTSSVELDVSLAPSSEGALQARLVIDYTGGQQIVELAGVGTRDRETYYTCSSGRPSGSGALALVLFGCLRRRRR